MALVLVLVLVVVVVVLVVVVVVLMLVAVLVSFVMAEIGKSLLLVVLPQTKATLLIRRELTV